MSTGQIKSLVRDRGFGFIQANGATGEIFFHRTSLAGANFDELEEGQSVEFDTEPDPRNPRRSRAVNVRVGA